MVYAAVSAIRDLPGMLPLRRFLIVQLPERAVQIELLLGQQRQLGVVAAALGFGDEGAEVAQAAFNGPLLDLLDGALDFVLLGWFGLSQQRLGQQSLLRRVFDHVHGVVGLAVGERLHGRKGAKVLKPGRLPVERIGRQSARRLVFRVGDGQSSEQHPLHFAERSGARLDAVATAERGLAQFLAQDG